MEYTLSEIAPGVSRLELRGRLDSAGADRLEATLPAAIDNTEHNVLADLSKVSFLGSLGIRLLIRIARSLKRRSLALVLSVPPPAILEVFHMAGLRDIIPVADSEAEGLALLASGAGSGRRG